MIGLIAEHARLRPDAVAVRQWDESLTYGELWAGATALAAELRERGAGPEVLIGLCADRRPELITRLLGILLSGAGYVPLDPTLPSARLHDMVREAGLGVVIGDRADLVDGCGGQVPLPRGPGTSSSVAYVMFTSGSTGRPKGVVIEHASLTEFVTSMAGIAGMDHASRSLGFASIGFDASVIDILAPLSAGGTVALVPERDRADPVRLQRFCVEHEVTVAFLPPAVLPLLDPAGLPELRVVLTGSEAPGPEQVQRWTDGGRRFFNLYGPTEGTVLVTWFEATGRWDGPLPIGTPAANHRVYIMDGELLVGGAGLARGYLGDPARTAERFIADPFSGVPGERLYRTGDLVRRDPDGTLRFLGRADRQVKVRGQRVELGEVEAVLRAHPEVDHAAVTALPDGLVAFVTSTVDERSIRDHCAHRLPAAMIPSRIHVVPELPLASSGKVDLDALIATVASPQGLGVFKTHKPGGLRVLKTPKPEERLAELWAELLGASADGEADFFDSGGHSITAMRLVAAIRDRMGRDVAIEDVLEGRTLRGIAARVAGADPLPEAEPTRGRPPALSPSQQRLWFLDHYSPEASAAYNIAFAERLRGPLDLPTLRAALTAVAARHEVLRWRIQEVDGQPHAVVDPPAPVPLVVEDLSRAEQKLGERLTALASERFALATDALWRARLFRLGPEEHVLAVTAHHAVFDGWSQSLLYQDLAAAYAGRALGPLPATYGDYVAWRAERKRRRADADLAWWVSRLDDVPTVLELPTDRHRPAEQTFAGGKAGVTLDVDTTAAVARLARELGATPSAVLLAAVSVLLARLTGQPDLVIGSPMVDRREADFQDMIGFFIEIAPLRLCPSENVTFAEQVRAARDELLAALAHPEAPLETIVHALGLGGRFDRGPLVQVLFNMFNFAEPRLELPGLTSEPVPVGTPGSPFDLTVYGIERDGRLRIEIVYNTDLFGQSRMAGLLEAVREVVVRGVADRDTPIGKLIPGVSGPGTAATVARARPRPAPVSAIHEAPATPTERAIAGVWGEVLGRAAVGASENFFDAGGSSMSIVMVQRRLNLVLGKEIRVVDLFRFPTVRALGGYLDGDTPGVDAVVARAARRGAARRQRRGAR